MKVMVGWSGGDGSNGLWWGVGGNGVSIGNGEGRDGDDGW